MLLACDVAVLVAPMGAAMGLGGPHPSPRFLVMIARSGCQCPFRGQIRRPVNVVVMPRLAMIPPLCLATLQPVGVGPPPSGCTCPTSASGTGVSSSTTCSWRNGGGWTSIAQRATAILGAIPATLMLFAPLATATSTIRPAAQFEGGLKSRCSRLGRSAARTSPAALVHSEFEGTILPCLGPWNLASLPTVSGRKPG